MSNEIKEEIKSLEEEIKSLQKIIEKQKPLVALAEARICKGECLSVKEASDKLNISEEQLITWARLQGFVHKKLNEVNDKGDKYFKVYSSDCVHNEIGITKCGMRYLSKCFQPIMKMFDNNQKDDIKTSYKFQDYLGYIYVLEYGNYVKIGCTTKPYERLIALKNQAEKYGNVQLGRIAISQEHTNYKDNERKLHKQYQEYRVNNTELFDVSIEIVVSDIPNCIELLDETEIIEQNIKTTGEFVKNYFSSKI